MKNKLSDLLQPLQLLRILAALSVLLAITAGILMSRAPRDVYAFYLAKDQLATAPSTVFVPAMRPLFGLPLQWLLIALLLVTALYAGYNALRDRRGYEDNLRGKTSLRRWVYYAVSSAIAIVIVGLLTGIQDIIALKLLAGLVVIAALLAWRTELEAQGNARRTSPYLYVLQTVAGALPWVAVIAALAFSAFYGLVRLPWYVYAAAAAVFIQAVLFWLNQFLQRRNQRAFRDYQTIERNYLLIDLASKVALAVILIVGLPR
jgi:cytochrome bd-type quinol oxidase subunit 2